MGRATVSAIYGLVTLAFSSCTTEVCDCLLVMDFRDELTVDSARVELVLRAQ